VPCDVAAALVDAARQGALGGQQEAHEREHALCGPRITCMCLVGFCPRLPGATLGLSPVGLPSFSALISSELWTRWAGQPEAVCGATTQNCWASAGSARPKCSSTGGVPVAPSEMMSHRRLPDSPAPCRYSSKGSGSSACGGVYTSAAKVFGSRISVRGELVEEAKRRGADSEAASAISVRGELVWPLSVRQERSRSALLAGGER
jgi:hypothetical protein